MLPRPDYDLPVPATRPPFSEFAVDDESNLWVAEYVELDDDPRSWRVFDPAGRLLGTVEMPARFRMFDIRGRSWSRAHRTFMEEPDRYLEVLTSFLDDVDEGAPLFASVPSGPDPRTV